MGTFLPLRVVAPTSYRIAWFFCVSAMVASACGGPDADVVEPPPQTATPQPALPTPPAPAEVVPPTSPQEAEVTETAELTVSAPAALEVIAGERLGQISIGMTRAQVEALGLAQTESDWQREQHGIYHIIFRDNAVHRIEVQMGQAERIRFAGQIIEAGTHIGEIRDIFGECHWRERGGEYYRCHDGKLIIHTTHRMDPRLYTLAVVAQN